MHIVRSTAATATAILAGLAALALLIVWLVNPNHADAGAAPVTVSGHVFYDRNDNGVRDPGEPGLAGIRIHDKATGPTTLTGSDGSYAFESLPTSGYLQVETGWFRSQCPPASKPTATSCKAGPGPDNDFAVANQFVRYALTSKLTSKKASNIDVGLIPDWPGRSMAVPAPVAGVVPANPVDIAARLSWSSGTCVDSTYQICRAGDTFTMDGQLLNQGTTALTGLRARVYVPPGDCATGVATIAYTVPSDLGALTVSPAVPTCSTRYLDLAFTGSLPPAADVRVLISGETATGPGTPGCVTTKIDKKRCPTAEPQGRGWLLGISHIDQTGDPDSMFCAAGDATLCPIGLHDKRRAPDDIDPAGHNVDAALGGPTTYDLSANIVTLNPTTIRAWVTNSGGVPSPVKTQVKVWLPAGTTVVAVPPKHILITCDTGKPSGSAVVVTCTFGGPIAATLSSPAIDLTLAAAPTRAVACVTTPPDSPAESVPAAPGCTLSTDATTTPTDNDALVS